MSVIAIEKLSTHSLKQKAVQYTQHRLTHSSSVYLSPLFQDANDTTISHLSDVRSLSLLELFALRWADLSSHLTPPQSTFLHFIISSEFLSESQYFGKKNLLPPGRGKIELPGDSSSYQVSSWANPFLPVLFWGRLFCCCLVEFWWLNLGPHACWANVLPLRATSQALIKFSFVCLKLWINFHQIAQAGI